MLDLSTNLTKATTAFGAKPARRVKIDFDRSGTATDVTKYVQSISITRSLTTDVPDGTRLVAGYSSSSTTLDLGGDPADNDKTGSWVWSPRNADSPFYGKKRLNSPVTVELGFDTGTKASPHLEYATRFTGFVNSLDTQGGDVAELQAGDQAASKLRNQVLLPMATNLGHPSLDGRFFIDAILTANGIDPDDQDLEESLNPLTATPYTSDKQDSWTLIQQIAAAEDAVAFFDTAGTFHFWNREHFTKQSVNYTTNTVTANGVSNPIPTITTSRNLKTLTTVEDVTAIRNHVVVTYAPLEVQPGDFIWQSTFPHGVHSRSTETIWATFDNPVQSISSTFVVVPIGGDTGGDSGYRACTTQDGTGDPVENLTFDFTQLSATTAKIVVHNPNGFPAYLVEPRADSLGHLYPGWDASTPRPVLMLYGRSVTPVSDATSDTNGSTGATVDLQDDDSIDDYGEQLLTVDGAGWIQDADTARTLCEDLLTLLARPVFYLGDVDVVGDLRYELGDRAALEDLTGTAMDDHVWIVGITETPNTSSGYAQSLTLRLTAAVGSMVWGHPTRGKWGAGLTWGGIY